MTQLVLKRASASRPSGEWSDDDYDVLAEGKVIGRITKAAAGTPGLTGFKKLSVRPPHRPGAAAGAHFCEAEDQVLGP